MRLIGRQTEQALLGHLLNSGKPEFVAIYGRRRVGKTFLVREFFKGKDLVFFNVTGQQKGSLSSQLKHFIMKLGETFYGGADLKSVKTWEEAFEALTKAINLNAKEKPVVLFLDELPWLATRNSKLLQSLEYYWNQYWSQNPQLKLIICGSSASWIIKKVIKNKGGLHNRVTEQISLMPFKLSETELYLKSINVDLPHHQLVALYMAVGGVPFYLSKVKPGFTAIQAIEQLAFSHKAFLLEEFDHLFSSLFEFPETYLQIVRILAEHPYGVGQRRLLEALGSKEVGSAGLEKLSNLEEAGFIKSFKPLYNKKKGKYYRLIDEYTIFYLKWIEPIKDSLQADAFDLGNWQAVQHSPNWYSWQGMAFETLCYRHLNEIRRALKLPPNALASVWRYAPSIRSGGEGAQVDLLFDHPDNAITLCEIKFTEMPFVITKEYFYQLERKIKVFKAITKTTKPIFLAMIAAQGLKNNYYAEELIHHVITLEDLFHSV